MSLRVRYPFDHFFNEKGYIQKLPKEGYAFINGGKGNHWASNYRLTEGVFPTWKIYCSAINNYTYQLGITEQYIAKQFLPIRTGIPTLERIGYKPDAIVPINQCTVLAQEYPSCCGAVSLFSFGIGEEKSLGAIFFTAICDWLRYNKYGVVNFILTDYQSNGLSYLLNDSAIKEKLTKVSNLNPNSGSILDSYILQLV